jgi:hypothetical protein
VQAFSAAWLALREPADARARSSAVVDALRRRSIGGSGFSRDSAGKARLKPLPQESSLPGEPLSIVDLGAGTGANLRYLAPRLGGKQDWLLVDSDSGLLGIARAKLLEWAATLDAGVETDVNGISIAAASFSATVRTQKLDIALELEALDLPRGGLVTASALLDLVSQRWLEALADACHAARANVLFALTYDGRMTLEPPEPDDELARALFNRHQRTDKGFGPALGPEAAQAAEAAFAQRGYLLEPGTSDWCLGGETRALQAQHLDGWLRAACEIEPKSRPKLARWHARHRRWIDAGQSRILVGHADFAGVPR